MELTGWLENFSKLPVLAQHIIATHIQCMDNKAGTYLADRSTMLFNLQQLKKDRSERQERLDQPDDDNEPDDDDDDQPDDDNEPDDDDDDEDAIVF